jgi:hypothetical protein
MMTMNRTRETLREVMLVSFGGFFLLGIVLLTPNGGAAGETLFQIARSTTWAAWLDWPAVWCSFKMILLSASLFLLVDSMGTLLLVLNQRRLAGRVFILIVLPLAGFLVGGYYFVKSLL